MSLKVNCEADLQRRVRVDERSGREESVKRVYATTQRRVIHMKLSNEMIPVKRVKDPAPVNTR